MDRRDFLKATSCILYGLDCMPANNFPEKQTGKEKPGPKNSDVAENHKKAYLRTVEVTEGCFSREKAVELEDYEGSRTSGFFGRKHIRGSKLAVVIAQEKDNLVMVKLPGRTLEAPGDKGYMTVNKKQLEYTA